ncbi:hypothetical protein RHSIM_Rhsim04G0020700 [Rhododendron simsii]|uniref:RING-type E3 ubiquitin transferase n=1 Tax=Rhododendron simsii TaxID=118357 RepID=A0A834LRS6_RHOSS|nr:hypothetical protein RHSIM_Rhsim04G0020700 [Rhododendron simsii]
MVPESTPTAPSTTIFPYLQPVLSHYTGGDRILNNFSSEFSFQVERYFRFRPAQNISETNKTGIHKIKAYLIFKSPKYYDLPDQSSTYGGSYFPISSSTSITYSHHCASMVPESTPTTPSTATFPYVTPVLAKYTGGDGILNNTNISSESEEKYFWFLSTKNIFETNTSGVYKMEASLIFGSSGSSFHGNHRRRNSLEFAFDGFWSQNSGKLCMVGSASWYPKENLINLDAVLNLNYAVNLTIFSSLITGKLESLASPNDPNYFEPISLMELGTSSNYQYTLVSGEFDRDCRSGIDIPKYQSLGLEPSTLCFTMITGRYDVFNLEYSNECRSVKNCTPLGKDGNDELPREMTLNAIQCSVKEHKLLYVIKFGSGYQPFDPSTTLVGEASWDENKNQLCIVACRLLNSTGSLENVRVGDCSFRLSLRYPAFWSIRNRTSIVGQIWTNKTSNDLGYFHSIAFRSRYNNMFEVPGLRYEYTVTDKVRKVCPFNKPVTKKGDRYPKGNSNDLTIWVSGGLRALPNFVGDQIYDVRNPFRSFRPVSTRPGPLNVSYTISYFPKFSAVSGKIPHTMFDISAEGLYDEETGNLCMVGCRKLSTGESMDCEILLKFQFPPVNAKEGGQIRGSIESMREETDPLYFKQWEIIARPNYREEAERSVQRLDLEMVMVLISSTLACVFLGLQILYAKRNPQVLPFVSLAMLLFLILGHMIPLVLELEALFRGNRNPNHVLLGSGGWVEVNNFIVRALTVVAFLLQLRLLQLAFSARSGNRYYKALWVAEKKALFVSTTLYTLGLLFVLFLSTRKQNHSKAIDSSNSVVHHIHYIRRDLIRYDGLVLDGFLLPQILFNIFQVSTKNALSHLFYIGTTCVRLLPHAYDLYLTHSYPRLHGAYIFANPNSDFYSTAWDIVILYGVVLFTVAIYLQQRFGGRCIFPWRFREVEVYEMVPVASSDQ